jgi:multidrug transporter EmrE-like cation transporter
MSLIDIGILSLVEIVGDFGLKEFANNGGAWAFTTGIAGYVGVVYYLIRSLQGSNILTVNNIWDGFSSIVESIAAYLFLGERFEFWYQYLGIIMIIFGVFLLKVPLDRKNKFVFPKIFP